MGEHRYDAQMPALSPRALKNPAPEPVGRRAELAAGKPRNLDDQIDAEIMRDAIDLELLYLREIRDWEWDPRLNDSFPYYDPREIVAGRLSDIMHGDFASEAERRKSVTAQLNALPAFLLQQMAALD